MPLPIKLCVCVVVVVVVVGGGGRGAGEGVGGREKRAWHKRRFQLVIQLGMHQFAYHTSFRLQFAQYVLCHHSVSLCRITTACTTKQTVVELG